MANNSFQCMPAVSRVQRLFQHKECVLQNSWSSLNLRILSMSIRGGAFSTTWLRSGSFPNLVVLDMDDRTWQASVASDEWKKSVCMSPELFTASRGRFQQLSAVLAGLRQNNTVGNFSSLLPRLHTVRSLDGVCSNHGAETDVAVIWGVFVACLIVMLAICVWAPVACTQQAAKEPAVESRKRFARLKGLYSSHIAPMMALGSLTLYWADILLDVLVIANIWGHWPGYVLVSTLVGHYIIAGVIMAVFVARHYAVKWLAALPVLMLVLTIGLPALDTAVFVSVVSCGLTGRCLSPKLNIVEYQHMRDLVRAFSASLPTAILQSIVYVEGNNPHLGWYLSRDTVLWSVTLSAVQVLKVVAQLLARRRGSAMSYLWSVVTGDSLVAEGCILEVGDKRLVVDSVRIADGQSISFATAV